MFIQLLGGLVDEQASLAAPILDREEVGTPSECDNMRADEIAAALAKVLRDHGLTVSVGDADDSEPRSP